MSPRRLRRHPARRILAAATAAALGTAALAGLAWIGWVASLRYPRIAADGVLPWAIALVVLFGVLFWCARAWRQLDEEGERPAGPHA